MGALFNADYQENGTPYGPDSQSSSITPATTREVYFGPNVSAPGPNHFDIRNIKVGTSGFGSSDLFAPALTSLADFDAFYGAGTDPTFSGGIMSFNNVDDRYGVFDLGADYDEIWVQFELRVYADDNDPDYHDIGAYSGSGAANDEFTGIYNGGSNWRIDGPPSSSFGVGAIQDGTTWTTLGLHWYWTALAVPTVTSFSPTAGPINTLVDIYGSGFDVGISDIEFNGTSVSTLISDSDTHFQAYVPVGATTGPISVTTDGGTATSSDDFTVTPPPLIVFSNEKLYLIES